MFRRSTAVSATRRLQQWHGAVQAPAMDNPISELVATILSQNTTDVNAGRAYTALRKRWPRWEQVARAPEEAIYQTIRNAGLGRIKAPRIKSALLEIRKREGRFSLERLRRLSIEESRDYLTSLPGIGRKSASCVLLFALGRPAMPVDTHVLRVTKRLGWMPQTITADRAGEQMERIVPAHLILPLHLLLIQLGRKVCRPSRPRCEICPLRRICAYASKRGN